MNPIIGNLYTLMVIQPRLRGVASHALESLIKRSLNVFPPDGNCIEYIPGTPVVYLGAYSSNPRFQGESWCTVYSQTQGVVEVWHNHNDQYDISNVLFIPLEVSK